ncbi:DUF5829 family protein [Galbibacter sp. PAP.153]|uniref:DUF5829 family protein n=1 Tax=Galbibacter sp. PAP.153 TaxID=3104623 RepID=UPI00300A97A1
MNFYNQFLLLIMLLIVSCKGKTDNANDKPFSKEKIVEYFGKDVSKVVFNHLYVVVDSLSYAKFMENKEWRNSYASMDMGLPNFQEANKTAASCYVRGHKHYIEILGPNNIFNEPVGKSGLGYSLENKGEHFHLGIEPRLKANGTSYLSASETVDMPFGDTKQTWFKAFYTPSPGTALYTWYAFYNPSFLEVLYGDDYTIYSRETYLKGSYTNEKLFQGVEKLELICTIKDYNRIAQEMRHLGCELIKKENETLSIASGDIVISISPSTKVEFSRVNKLHCILNNLNYEQVELGNLLIKNNGKESVWDFSKLYK